MTYTVDSRLQNVDANKLLSSVSSMRQLLYGMLAANADTSFTASSADQITRTLNGKLSLNLRDGRLMNVDLLHQLATVGKFLNLPRAQQNFTNIAQLTGDFLVRNGVATTDNLKAAIDGGTMAAHGAVNLAEQTLDMKVTAVLSKALSQQVGGTGVGGFMNTALANRNGELVIPVIITGSLQRPQVSPDLEQIAKMKLQNMVPTLGNPGDLTSGILGQILGGGEQRRQGEQQPQQQQGGIEGIIDALGGRKKQPQPPQSTQPADPQQPPQQQENQQQQQQPKDPGKAVTDILNQVLGGQQKKQPAQQQQPPPEEQKEQPRI
jgi:AsmA protein